MADSTASNGSTRERDLIMDLIEILALQLMERKATDQEEFVYSLEEIASAYRDESSVDVLRGRVVNLVNSLRAAGPRTSALELAE